MQFEDDSNYAGIRKKIMISYKSYTLAIGRNETTVQRIIATLGEF